MGVAGPFAADTVFTDKYIKKCHCILAMYHDQGLPVIKAKAFGKIANISLGLPFIRTSVDHGTDFDIAGKGFADGRSRIEAWGQAAGLGPKRDVGANS